MDKLKSILENIDARAIAQGIRNNWGPLLFVVVIALALIGGYALGYTPEAVLGWLGL